MNRRRFLSLLSAGAFGALTLDVEKLLWVPGAKKIFLPPPPSFVAPAGLAFGDVFTIDGVWAIHPTTGRATSYLQRFMVTSADGAFMPSLALVKTRCMV